MKPINWTEVEEYKGSTILDPGAYVCRITKVTDHPEWNCLVMVYDVIEGAAAGTYADCTPDEDWKHEFRAYYTDNSLGMFKGMVSAFEKSNPGFVWDGVTEGQFVGKTIGLVMRKEYYTGNDGTDKETTKANRAIPAQDARDGKFKMPEPYDRRQNKSKPIGGGSGVGGGAYAPDGSAVYDLPF